MIKAQSSSPADQACHAYHKTIMEHKKANLDAFIEHGGTELLSSTGAKGLSICGGHPNGIHHAEDPMGMLDLTRIRRWQSVGPEEMPNGQCAEGRSSFISTEPS